MKILDLEMKLLFYARFSFVCLVMVGGGVPYMDRHPRRLQLPFTITVWANSEEKKTKLNSEAKHPSKAKLAKASLNISNLHPQTQTKNLIPFSFSLHCIIIPSAFLSEFGKTRHGTELSLAEQRRDYKI